MAHRALAHKVTDDVAVAVADLQPGEELTVQSLEGGKPLGVTLLEAVPLGHKVALKDMAVGHVVIEYGEKVGKVTKAVKKGGWVHVHNIRTLRWDYGKAGGGRSEAKGTGNKREAGGKSKDKNPSTSGRGAGVRGSQKGGK